MAKAGGIIAIIAGVLGIFAALFTLSVGGMGGALGAEQADTVTSMGIAGLLLSFLVITFGAVAISSPKGGGWCLFFTSIAGIIYGGTIVGIFMILALIGGILALIGAGSPQAEVAAPTVDNATITPQKQGGILSALRIFVMVILFGIIALSIIGILGGTDETSVSDNTPAGEARDSTISKPAAAKITIMPMGEKVLGEYFEVTVNNFEMQDKIVTLYEAESAGHEMLFAALHLTVTCIDKESRFYNPGNLMIHLEDGSQIMYDNTEIFLGLDDVNQQLNPYTTAKGFVVYKIPERFKNEKITWSLGRSFSNVYVLLQERSIAPE